MYENLPNQDQSVQYTAAVLWSLSLISSVGNASGILPQNHEERVFTIFATIISTCYFVYGYRLLIQSIPHSQTLLVLEHHRYMFTTLMTLISSKRKQSSRMNERLMSIMSYMQKKNFPRNLFRKVYRYYHHYYERKTAFDEAQILGELSEKLRGEVSSFMAFTTFSSAELFHKYDVKYLTLILLITKPVRVQHGESIIEAGQLGVEMFLITSGSLCASYKLFRSKERKLVQGDMFGELCALVRRRRRLSLSH